MSEESSNFASSTHAHKLGNGMRTDELHHYISFKQLDTEQLITLEYKQRKLNNNYHE